MSDNYNFDMNTWYMTDDYQDLLRMERIPGTPRYAVVVFYSGEMRASGPLKMVRQYMKDHCISHEDYLRWRLLDE